VEQGKRKGRNKGVAARAGIKGGLQSKDSPWGGRNYIVLQCVAVYYSVVQCVAVCCSVLQCITVWCNVLQCVAS